jgi:regulator of PEP synthase PpsR (kinase-PPPase family)
MKKHHLHLISDSTGGTLSSVVKACLAQFAGVETEQHFWPLVRTERQLEAAVQGILKNPGMTLYTFVDEALSRALERQCAAAGAPCVAVLDPVLRLMTAQFGQESAHEPGLQHRLNAEYFARMDAVDYALSHDDGQRGRNLGEADVILIGVSRTSKTPTCVYLANRGVKAANVPLVPGIDLAPEVMALKKPLFVGLTASAERLVEIRRNRLRQLDEQRETSYVDIDRIEEELTAARRLCGRMGWPVIDVTRRSVEETAAEILSLLEQRRMAQNPAGEGSRA